jgi:hypothetical protein
MGVGGQCHALATLPPGKTWYPLYRRLGGAQGWSGQVRKMLPPPGFNPWTVQPVVSCYTDYAIPAPTCINTISIFCKWLFWYGTARQFLSFIFYTYKMGFLFLNMHIYVVPFLIVLIHIISLTYLWSSFPSFIYEDFIRDSVAKSQWPRALLLQNMID